MEDIKEMIKAKEALRELESKGRRYLLQKSRIRWDIDGEKNIKVFHEIINGNKKRKKILRPYDRWFLGA